MLKQLDKNKIIKTLTHVFRSGYSCETQLINNDLQYYNKLTKGKKHTL